MIKKFAFLSEKVQNYIEFSKKMLYIRTCVLNFSKITFILHFDYKNMSFLLDFLDKM